MWKYDHNKYLMVCEYRFFQLLPETVILKLGCAYPLVYAKVLQGVHK